MKFYNKLICLLLIFFTGNVFAQFNPFKESTERNFSEKEKFVRKHNPANFKVYSLNLKNVLEWAKNAPELSERPSDLVVTLPDANGQLTNYWVYNNAAMEAELAENVSNIRSLKAVDIKNNGNSVSISISDIFGLHGMGMKSDGSVFYIDNYTTDLNNVIIYQRNSLELPKNNFTCLVPGDSFDDVEVSSIPVQTLSLDNKRRTYRLALACTIEYAAYHVNNAPAGTPSTTVDQKKNIVLAAMNVTLTRLNQIFERELNVHLNLVATNKNIIFITSDNFSNNNANSLIGESQTVIDNVIGTANYDMGHTFSTGQGGLASLGSVCSPWQKASGITGSPAPVGDAYDVDYVAHEMGHQFGANHTFNNSCQFNRNNSTAVETGSGSTIMSYAGICFPNVQNNVDAYYHNISIREMQTFLLSATCAQQTTVTNSPPVVTALTARTIPYGTPFILSTTATDPNTADQLTYTFEQVNTQIASQPPVATATTGPAFRSVAPSTDNFRSFPSMATVLDGTTFTHGIVSAEWERLATVGRTYSFVATVRDNNATGARVVYTQPVTITTANTGPFVITEPNNNPSTTEPVWFMGSIKTITWNVAGTTANNINTAEVNILVSTDNGLTYTPLASNVPNNGSATVTIPTNLTSTYDARIKIEAVGNIFYTVSKKFTLWDPNLSTEDVTLDNLKIYPNPTTNILNIEFSTTDIEKVKFDIFDLNGRLIKTASQENSNQVNQQINVESLQTGTYILVINTGKYTSTHKFIKK